MLMRPTKQRLWAGVMLGVVLAVGWNLVSVAAEHDGKMKYPQTQRSEQTDNYHGETIADPYRWLEDVDSEQTRAWVQAENEVTGAFLRSIPRREAIRSRLTQLWNFVRYGVPSQRGGRYFYSRNDGLQNQAVLYTADTLDAEPRVLIDPNQLSADGTVALSGTAISEDGKFLAYGLSKAGSDWQQWKVREIANGQDREDLIDWVKFSGAAWTKDGKGFFYSRFDEPNEETKFTAVNYYHKLYFHELGKPQSADTLVYHRDDEKEWGFHADVTDDGRYLLIDVTKGTERKNLVFYKDLSQPDAPVVELISQFEAQYHVVGNEGATWFVVTDEGAPRSRLVAIDLAHPEKANWKTLVPESEDLLESVGLVGDQFFAVYLHQAHSQVRRFDLNGKLLGEVALPGIGTAAGFDGRRSDRETFFSFTGFTTPTTIYRYDLATNQSTVFKQPQVDFKPDDYETRQVTVTSKDGTKVPMFIVHRKGLKYDGNNPTLLYGYGGFNVPLTPVFSVSRLVWMEMGGVYAVPSLRGGGEFGRDWHEAGMLAHKQNVFDDFIASAEWLIEQKITSSSKLAISGGSNGGLLVGACLVQRPDLFGAALPAVGVLDMLRFHKFTIGWAWVSEYGSADNEADYPVLRRYSPLHNLKAGAHYPATLITTADHDDRVVPAHSFKFAAALQHAQGGEAPALIRIETSAGHGAGKPTSKIIEEVADCYAFLTRVLRMDPPN